MTPIPAPVEIGLTSGAVKQARVEGGLDAFDSLEGILHLRYWDGAAKRWQDGLLHLEDVSYVHCIPWPDTAQDNAKGGF